MTYDLGYDPLDYKGKWTEPWGVKLLYGEAVTRQTALVVLENMLEIALPYFDTVLNIEDLSNAYEAARARKAIRNSFDASVSWHLAYALTLAKIGQVEEGREWLEKWRDGYNLLPHRTWQQVSAYFDQIAIQNH